MMKSERRDRRFMRSSKFRESVFAFLAIAAVATPTSNLKAQVQASPAEKAQESQAGVEGPRGAHRAAGARRAKAVVSKHPTDKAKALPLEGSNSLAAMPAHDEEKPQSGWSGAYGGLSGGAAGGSKDP
jgi:hypothetical protein